jgi:hypothetical protein
MKTLREKYIAALIASGEHEVTSKSRKFVTLTKKGGGFWFVGRAGSLRYGQRSSSSFAAMPWLKRRVLAELEAPPAQEAPPC